jgi:diguanylate cyclase (GGDEF)-like protein/PAS domain S-box-containing protein
MREQPKQENVLSRPGASLWQWLLRGVAWFGLTKTPVDADAPVQRRVRVSMYAVLLIVGAVSAWQAWQVEKTEAVRLADAEIVRLAAAQSMLSQRMGMLAALLTAGDGKQAEYRKALKDSISQSQQQAPRLEQLLNQQGVLEADTDPSLRKAVLGWQGERERLWYRAEVVLRHSEAANSTQLIAAIELLRNEVEPALLITQRLAEQVQLAAQQRAHLAVGRIEFSALVMVLLLLVLTLVVAEPLARFVRRQHQALAQQSSEIKRLALVAERTSNWVAVVDARRRILWCNQAFLRGKGCSLEDVLGQTPRLLRANERNDAAEIERLLVELDMGLSVRAEIMHRSPNDQEVWLDVDYQPIHDAAGRLTGFTVVAGDITERVNQRLRMRTMLDALPAGVVLQSASGEVIECNQVATEILGFSRQELMGRTDLVRADAAVREDLTPYPSSERPANRTLRTGKGMRGESIGLLSPEGNLRWVLVNTEPMTDATGRVTGVVSCSVDVTEQRAQQQLLALAIEGASLGMWHWEIPTGVMSCNDRLLDLYGYEADVLGMQVADWNAIIHPEDLAGWLWAVKANLRDSKQPLHWEMRIRNGRSGRWIWMMYGGTVVARDAHGRALRMAGICFNINAQKELEEQLRVTARTDSLTQLPNRSELLYRIQASIQRTRAQPGFYFAVLFLDFDRFKQVNDTLGHAVGDELLRQIAQRLRDSLRPSDAFVQTSDFNQMAARIGGDEFVVLLDDIRGDLDAQVVASRLIEVLGLPYEIGAHRVDSSVSIGIVTTEHMDEDADSVLRDADIAMYEAKRQGRGRFEMFHPSMRKRLRDDASLESDLRHALEKGELSVVYQPLIDLTSGALYGIEALARWQHPQRGPVSPLSFIPIAEASGLIEPLGRFVLKTACEELVRLRSSLGDQAPDTVSVNLSRAQLRKPGFVDHLSDVLFATGVAPGQLILEVTETLAAQDEAVQATLREIRSLGVSLSLDDFGTGYSSLSCLHELPVNAVKIDRSFVGLALRSDYHRVMIEATIRMAQTLGLKTVAEGIETEAQEQMMSELGCDKGQGYLYSRPLSAQALVQWAASRGAVV